MKQTIRVGDNISRKLRDEVSADLKGYVTVQVKNKHTGEVEHQENHNLIVYGGREWLLRRIFGSSIANNEYAMKSGIKWVGFGCGGGEAGNPLQAGTTLGHDADLYQPCRIRFPDDSNNNVSNGFYASRILPNGSIVSGYFKKISNVTIKEDHANPYIENNIRKYPRIIAEVRVELSSDDCNGENYTENGNLTAYQDINEVGLFISDLDSNDPGQGEYDEKVIDIVQGDFSREDVYTNKVFLPANVTQEFTKSGDNWTLTVNTGFDPNAYLLQYQYSNGEWKTVVFNGITTKAIPVELVTGNNLTITRTNSAYETTGPDGQIADWSADNDLNNLPTDISGFDASKLKFRIISVGIYLLSYKKAIETSDPVLCEIQYRNYSNQLWKTIDTKTLTGSTTSITNKKFLCNTVDNPDIGPNTLFRVRQTVNSYQNIKILASKTDSTSNEVKYYVSENDIKFIKVNNYVFTGYVDNDGNYIPETAPAGVLEVYDPEVQDPEVADQQERPYFIVEKADAETKSYPDGLNAYTYAPSAKSPYTLFSRVTLSSVRKTTDREIVIIWKIYC